MLKGTLDDFVLGDIFRLIGSTQRTGRLDVSRKAGDGSVFFAGGEVYHAETSLTREPLGRKLVRSGHTTEGRLRKALDEHAATGRKIGEVLVASGAVTPEAIAGCVRAQVEDACFELLRWETGEFAWHAEARVEVELAVSVTVENLIMEASRRTDELDVIKRKIPSLDAVPLLAPRPPDGADAINIAPEEWRALVLVDGHRTVSEIAAEVGLDDFMAMRTLYGLVSTGLVELETLVPAGSERRQEGAAGERAAVESVSLRVAAPEATPAATGPALDPDAGGGSGEPADDGRVPGEPGPGRDKDAVTGEPAAAGSEPEAAEAGGLDRADEPGEIAGAAGLPEQGPAPGEAGDDDDGGRAGAPAGETADGGEAEPAGEGLEIDVRADGDDDVAGEDDHGREAPQPAGELDGGTDDAGETERGAGTRGSDPGSDADAAPVDASYEPEAEPVDGDAAALPARGRGYRPRHSGGSISDYVADGATAESGGGDSHDRPASLTVLAPGEFAASDWFDNPDPWFHNNDVTYEDGVVVVSPTGEGGAGHAVDEHPPDSGSLAAGDAEVAPAEPGDGEGEPAATFTPDAGDGEGEPTATFTPDAGDGEGEPTATLPPEARDGGIGAAAVFTPGPGDMEAEPASTMPEPGDVESLLGDLLNGNWAGSRSGIGADEPSGDGETAPEPAPAAEDGAAERDLAGPVSGDGGVRTGDDDPGATGSGEPEHDQAALELPADPEPEREPDPHGSQTPDPNLDEAGDGTPVLDRSALVRELAGLFDDGDGQRGRVRKTAAAGDVRRRVEDDDNVTRSLISRLIDGVKGL